MSVNEGSIEWHLLRKTTFDTLIDASCCENYIVKRQVFYSAWCIIEELHLWYAIRPSRVTRCVVVLIKTRMSQIICSQHISQTILVFWNRTAESRGTAYFNAFVVGGPCCLYFHLHRTLCPRSLFYIGKQTEGLFVCTAVAVIGSHNMCAIEYDFRTSWEFFEDMIIIASIQCVTIVRC